MELFNLYGYNGEHISLTLKEVLGFPNKTCYEGGYIILQQEPCIVDTSLFKDKENDKSTQCRQLENLPDKISDKGLRIVTAAE